MGAVLPLQRLDAARAGDPGSNVGPARARVVVARQAVVATVVVPDETARRAHAVGVRAPAL